MNDMVDMSRFVEAKSDQLNADDLIDAPRTITVTRVTGNDGEQPVSIHYQGDNGKPFKPCKTMRRVLLAIWKRHAADYVGRSMTLYRDDSVTFGGLATGGIRISHMSGIDKETIVVVMKSKGKKAGIKIQPLKAEQPAVEGGQQQRRQSPADWVAEQLPKIKVADVEGLKSLKTKTAKTVASLEEKFPPQFKRMTDAFSEREQELTASADFNEGPADSQRGESHNGSDPAESDFVSADDPFENAD